MLPRSVKVCLLLLWGTSGLFSPKSLSVSVPVTSNPTSTSDPNATSEHLSTEPDAWSVSAAAEEETTDDSVAASVSVATSSSTPEQRQAFTAGDTGDSHSSTDLRTPTTTPASPPKSPPATAGQPCSMRGRMSQCLIAIASLAGLAAIFMVSTVVLCAKLSTRPSKGRKQQPATEMMCISSLLPEKNYTYTRQRNPVPNGVLVIHNVTDSDEEGGDNLTLSSFLPENDRFV
uniref:P-selectin glycoprotein ligand 1 n=1 Tax=Takifugu rubripes TaxID=31033 RepID=A0A3B5KM95_TAKRU